MLQTPKIIFIADWDCPLQPGFEFLASDEIYNPSLSIFDLCEQSSGARAVTRNLSVWKLDMHNVLIIVCDEIHQWCEYMCVANDCMTPWFYNTRTMRSESMNESVWFVQHTIGYKYIVQNFMFASQISRIFENNLFWSMSVKMFSDCIASKHARKSCKKRKIKCFVYNINGV